jgi:hypothetical protein
MRKCNGGEAQIAVASAMRERATQPRDAWKRRWLMTKLCLNYRNTCQRPALETPEARSPRPCGWQSAGGSATGTIFGPNQQVPASPIPLFAALPLRTDVCGVANLIKTEQKRAGLSTILEGTPALPRLMVDAWRACCHSADKSARKVRIRDRTRSPKLTRISAAAIEHPE